MRIPRGSPPPPPPDLRAELDARLSRRHERPSTRGQRYSSFPRPDPRFVPLVGEEPARHSFPKQSPLAPAVLLQAVKTQINAWQGPLGDPDLHQLLSFIFSRGTRRADGYGGTRSVLELMLESASARAAPRARRQPVHKGWKGWTEPLGDDQLRALMHVYGGLELVPKAQRRLEETLACIQLGPEAERDKPRYAALLLAALRRRGATLDAAAVSKLAHVFRLGGLSKESQAGLGALLRDLPLSPEAQARLREVMAEPVAGAHAPWTFLVYLGRDGYREGNQDLLLALEKLGSTPGQVNVVALVGDLGDRLRLIHLRKGEGEAGRFYSVDHAVDRRSSLGRRIAEDSLRATDPAFVRAAIEYVQGHFPSDHLALCLYGRNMPFFRFPYGSILAAEDYREALEGLGVDLLAVDADSSAGYEHGMAAAEAGVKYLVGSGHFETQRHGMALPYVELMRRMAEAVQSAEGLSAAGLASLFVELGPRGGAQGFSSVDMERFEVVHGKLSLLAWAMVEAGGLTQNRWLRACWDQCERAEGQEEVAVRELARRIAERFDGALARTARELLAALETACRGDEASAALAIHAPRRQACELYDDQQAPWGRGSWVALIESLYEAPDPEQRVPAWAVPPDVRRALGGR